IDAFSQFAAIDLEKPVDLETKRLFHIGDANLRKRLSEVLYGARWIYKLGLALLVRNEEQAAHVRAQITDYAAVCEGILLDMIDHGLQKGMLTGSKHKFHDPDKKLRP